MKIYNSLTRKKEDFVPREGRKVKFYVCGPTVYDNAHLGHGRSAVAFDVIRRYLIYRGFEVTYVSNYTDIDDKMINRANEEGISVPELAEKIIPEYEKDYGELAVLRPDIQPKATEYIDEMIEIIGCLEEKGCTYLLSDGVYFDISKFPEYGKLSGQNLEELQMGARVDIKEEKRNPQDFVLWKFKKEGEPFWASPWGDGRPGWHIECSAMTYKCLGGSFDIHGGGLDLTFPHHECEIAQSEGCFGAGTFAKYWLHNGFINVDNEKMSKSLGNFFTLKDIFKKYRPDVVRFMFLQTHYRNPINFTDQILEQSKAGLTRLHDFVRNLDFWKLPEGVSTVYIAEYMSQFEEFMDNDFDTSGAIGVIFDLVKEVNRLKDKGELVEGDVNIVKEFLRSIDEVLQVIFVSDTVVIDQEIENLIEERNRARSNKDYRRSDEIRNELLAKGIALEDTPEGTIWKRVD